MNHRLAKYQLQQPKQMQEESIDDFMTRCRNQATKCKFRDDTDVGERLIEQLIIGTKHKKVQERLLSKGEYLTLDEAMDICRTYEAMLTQMGQLDSGQKKEIHGIGRDSKLRKCGNCGGEHLIKPKNKCPAYGTECKMCGKANHWARVCRSKREPRSLSRQRRTTRGRSNHRNTERGSKEKTANDKDRQYKDINDQFEAITFELISVNAVRPTQNEVFVTLKVDLNRNNNCLTTLKAKLDTGAQGNILPIRLYRQMYPQNVASSGLPKSGSLENSTTVLTAYGGTKIVQHGICKIPCEFQNRKSVAAFFITEADGPAIIGFPTSLELDLVTLNCLVKKSSGSDNQPTQVFVKPIKNKADLVSQYLECFDGIGKLQGQYHITLDPSIPPVAHAQRRVPLSLRDDIKNELAKMEAQGVIAKIKEGEPTTWVNSLVYRRKTDGSLRICLDPKDLNKAILREHHIIPTLEEILRKLSGAKLFSIVDAKCGYWNIELDDESSYLTTFNSPFGWYRFLRMPFGLKMSQDVFQAKIDQTFEGCKGVGGIADA